MGTGRYNLAIAWVLKLSSGQSGGKPIKHFGGGGDSVKKLRLGVIVSLLNVGGVGVGYSWGWF